MLLYLTSAYEEHPGLDTLIVSAEIDTRGMHELCASPERADAIVFIENTQFDDVLFRHLQEHKLIRKYADKVLMYNEMDRPWTLLPGLYTCLSRKHYDTCLHRAFAYLSTPNHFIHSVYEENVPRRWLYSFMGAMSHACRRRLMHLPQARALIRDTSGFNVWNSDKQVLESRAREYAQVIGASQFRLCPRGIGTSSLRLYEALEAGRAPVIISDQWVAPQETDWRFAIQVKENRISSIPDLLKSLENESMERGEAARNAWLRSYAPETLFNTLGNAVQDLLRQGVGPASLLNRMSLNKWLATGGLYTRTTLQRLRGHRQ